MKEREARKKAAGSAGGGEVWWCRRRGKKGGRNNRISLAPTSPRLPVRRCCLHTGTSTALWHPATCTLAPGPTAAFPHQPLPGGAGGKKYVRNPENEDYWPVWRFFGRRREADTWNLI